MGTILKFSQKRDTPRAVDQRSEPTTATSERFYKHGERTPDGSRFCQRLDIFGCRCDDAEATYCGSARWLGE